MTHECDELINERMPTEQRLKLHKALNLIFEVVQRSPQPGLRPQKCLAIRSNADSLHALCIMKMWRLSFAQEQDWTQDVISDGFHRSPNGCSFPHAFTRASGFVTECKVDYHQTLSISVNVIDTRNGSFVPLDVFKYFQRLLFAHLTVCSGEVACAVDKDWETRTPLLARVDYYDTSKILPDSRPFPRLIDYKNPLTVIHDSDSEVALDNARTALLVNNERTGLKVAWAKQRAHDKVSCEVVEFSLSKTDKNTAVFKMMFNPNARTLALQCTDDLFKITILPSINIFAPVHNFKLSTHPFRVVGKARETKRARNGNIRWA
jgi:hypothetical protein